VLFIALTQLSNDIIGISVVHISRVLNKLKLFMLVCAQNVNWFKCVVH